MLTGAQRIQVPKTGDDALLDLAVFTIRFDDLKILLLIAFSTITLSFLKKRISY